MTQIPTSKVLISPSIISEIFKNFSTPVAIDWRPKSFPWFLGHICARWRTVFLSMSGHFWGNIAIDVWSAKKPFPDSAAYFERALDILNFCLKCNKGCPLSFSFQMGIHCIQEYAYVTDILDAFIAQSMRWLKVELHLRVAEFQRLRHVKGRIPHLQSLVLGQVELLLVSMRHTPIESVYERFADTFEDSPSLTHIELYMSDIKAWKFDWSSIVVLRLELLTNADYLVAVLSQSVHLEELEVDWKNDSDSGPIDIAQGMITLSYLKRLTIHYNVCIVLGVLTAPALEYLSLRSDEGAATVTAFLRRSCCPLGHLELRYPLSPAVAAEVLSVIPGLPSLKIHECNVIELIRLLNSNLPEGALLIGPRLKSLQVHVIGHLKQGEVVALSAMVASRARNVEVDGLQELALWADDSWGEVDLTILQSRCEEQDIKLTSTVGKGDI